METPAYLDTVARLKEYDLPHHLIPGLARYLVGGIAPGSFLRAVLENDLTDTVLSADASSLSSLRELIHYLLEFAPAAAWGSPGLVEMWIEKFRSKVVLGEN